MAFRYQLAPSNNDSHQADPYWFAVIVRFANPRTFDRSHLANDLGTLNVSYDDSVRHAVGELPALFISSQIVNWQMSSSKSSHTSTATFKVLPGPVDFARQVRAGDWVLFWAFDNREDYARVAAAAAAVVGGEQGVCNGFLDGLKFVGRVNAPKRRTSVDPSTGRPSRHYQFTAVAFGEFDAGVYYNESMRALQSTIKSSPLASINAIASHIDAFIEKGLPITTRDHQIIWLNVFLGCGPGAASKGFEKGSLEGTAIQAAGESGSLVASPNDALLVPHTVGKLLGVDRKSLRYVDILNTFIGVQGAPFQDTPEARSRETAEAGGAAAYEGFVPVDQYPLTGPLGSFIPQMINFDNTNVWSILEQFSCKPINEMFTGLRVDSSGRIRPSYICRQIPFSSQLAKTSLIGRLPVTTFVSLPRWVMSRALVESEDVGHSDSLRHNFVSLQGVVLVGGTITSRNSFQQINAPPMADVADIRRSGVRGYVTSTNADVSGIAGPQGVGRGFNQLMADILFDLHMKWSGSLQSKFIQEPIAIGDNLEYDRVIYHIEAINHSGFIDGTGRKQATSSFSLSNGISTASDFAADDVMPGEDEPEEEFIDYVSRVDVVDEGELHTQDIDELQGADDVEKQRQQDIGDATRRAAMKRFDETMTDFAADLSKNSRNK